MLDQYRIQERAPKLSSTKLLGALGNPKLLLIALLDHALEIDDHLHDQRYA
jgi:hypothetical protein